MNIDYVKDENDNVNVKYYSIDPSSYIGKLAFPITLTSRLLVNHEEQQKRDSNTTRTINSDKVTSAFGNEARMSNNTTSEDAAMRPEDSSVKDSSQGELDEKQEVSSHFNLSPKKVNPFSKSSAIEDLEDEKKRDSPDLDVGITTGEVGVYEGVDSNPNSHKVEITEAEAKSVEQKKEVTPTASVTQYSDSSDANCKPCDELDKKQHESPKASELDAHCSPKNIKICKLQTPSSKAASSTKYDDELRIQVIVYSKFHNQSQKATGEKFGIPTATVGYWNRSYSSAYNVAVGVLDDIIEAAQKSTADKKGNDYHPEFSSRTVLSEAKTTKSKVDKRVKYPPEFRRTVMSYVKTHTHAQAAKKFNVPLHAIKDWKRKRRGQSSGVSPAPESFEDLYSDEDSLGAKKRKRRISNLGLNSSGDDDDANSLGVCKKRNERESTPISKVENKVTRTSSDSHQLRMDVLDYGAKHSFEEASEVFKVDMETISSWLYY